MAGLKFPSERLKVMDIETLQRIVATNLNNAQKALATGLDDDGEYDQEPVSEYTRDEGAKFIRESLELIFARPEQNHATSVIYSNVEGVAVEYGGIYQFLEQIVNQALDTLDQSGRDKALLRDQNTYVYILNNLMGEIKPLALSKEGVKYRELIEKIRDEDIDFTDSLKSYRILHSMSNIANPSKVAEKIVGKKACAWWEFLWC
jgi:hypothetical protein